MVEFWDLDWCRSRADPTQGHVVFCTSEPLTRNKDLHKKELLASECYPKPAIVPTLKPPGMATWMTCTLKVLPEEMLHL